MSARKIEKCFFASCAFLGVCVCVVACSRIFVYTVTGFEPLTDEVREHGRVVHHWKARIVEQAKPGLSVDVGDVTVTAKGGYGIGLSFGARFTVTNNANEPIRVLSEACRLNVERVRHAEGLPAANLVAIGSQFISHESLREQSHSIETSIEIPGSQTKEVCLQFLVDHAPWREEYPSYGEAGPYSDSIVKRGTVDLMLSTADHTELGYRFRYKLE